MSFESANFLLKTSVIFICETDAKSRFVKNSCEKFDVAKFERFNFSLIDFENDFDLIMKLEVNFHLRVCEGVML